jgi:hypothetical protein
MPASGFTHSLTDTANLPVCLRDQLYIRAGQYVQLRTDITTLALFTAFVLRIATPSEEAGMQHIGPPPPMDRGAEPAPPPSQGEEASNARQRPAAEPSQPPTDKPN